MYQKFLVLSMLLSCSSFVMAYLNLDSPKNNDGYYLCPYDNSEDECQTPSDASSCCGSKYMSSMYWNY